MADGNLEETMAPNDIDVEATIEDNSNIWLPMGGGRPHPKHCPDIDNYIVQFDGGNDPWSPHNWSSWKKLYTSIIVCYGTLVASFNSAIFAAGLDQASAEFRVSPEVGVLGTSLFVLGFASGPMIWAPGSELIGRRWPLTIGMLGSSIFTIGSATAKDVQTLIICRFFAGVFGASPLCIVPAVLADMYNSTYRGMAISIYALTVFGGPFTAPFIGEFISASELGWRWTLFLPAILGFSDVVLLSLTLRETYAPFILMTKAIQLRKQTGNWAIHAEHEKIEFDLPNIVRKYFTRPLRMLMTEPTVFFVSIYMSLIYGLVYGMLEAYPYIYQRVYGMDPAVGSLPFLGLMTGVCLALAFILSRQHAYTRQLFANSGKTVPEWRLPPAILGAFVFTGGLFWFGWTAYKPTIHWLVPTAAGVPIGFGVLCIFLPCFNYLVDAYLPLAASTVAANIMLRSAVAAGFPLFARQMFANLGVQWAGTLLGCLAAIMIPIPMGFRIFGPALRRRSRLLLSDS